MISKDILEKPWWDQKLDRRIEKDLINISGRPCNLLQSALLKKLYDNPTEVMIEEINKDSIYKPFLENIKRDDLVVLDVGANVGIFAAYISPICKKVACIEPTPNVVDVLKDVCRVANLKNVEILEGALCPTTGEIDFNINFGNASMNSLVYVPNENYGQVRPVDGYCLGDVLEIFDIDTVDFVKLDVEGSEALILSSESFYEHRNRIRSLYVEVHRSSRVTPKMIARILGEKLEFKNVSAGPHLGNPGIYASR